MSQSHTFHSSPMTTPIRKPYNGNYFSVSAQKNPAQLFAFTSSPVVIENVCLFLCRHGYISIIGSIPVKKRGIRTLILKPPAWYVSHDKTVRQTSYVNCH